MVSRRGIGFLVLATVLACLLGARSGLAGEKLDVVTTIAQLGDAARKIAGDRVQVTVLMGEGVDPHTYRPTRADIARLRSADLILWNGLYLEAQMETFLAALAREKPVVAVAEQLPEERLLQHETYRGKFDPHVWMDPVLWAEVVGAARDTLIAQDPEGRETYLANAERYLADLAALAAYARETLATVPERARVVVSAHDAFRYFGRAYGYEVVGIQGLSTESEAGLKRIEDIVSMLVDRKIEAVFVESSVADRNVMALVEGARARGQAVRIGARLFSDAMGAPGTYEGTYRGMIDHNVTAIARALGGKAPENGSLDRLGTGS
jgi:manganese/zinc/iron transport system substrate-binding protein